MHPLHLISQDYMDQRYDRQRIMRPRGGYGCYHPDTSITTIMNATMFDFTDDTLKLSGYPNSFEPAPFLYNGSQICNREGKNIAFYNGIDLRDQHGDLTRLDVFGSYPDNPYESIYSRNGSIILPLPGHDSIYVLIGANDFQYTPEDVVPQPNVVSSVVFEETSNGTLSILDVKQEILRDKFHKNAGMTACRHGNGRDWWILVPRRYSNTMHSLLLSPDGIRYYESYDMGTNIFNSQSYKPMFSPDGKWFTISLAESLTPPQAYKSIDKFQIYKFDRCSGRIYDPVDFTFPFQDSSAACQLIFDQNSRYIYAARGVSLWQGDIEADDILSSFIEVCHADFKKKDNFFGHAIGVGFQGPDNKIYFFDDNNQFGTTVIHHPEQRGSACEAVYSDFYKPGCTGMSVGNMPYFSLGPLDGSPCDTLELDGPLVTDGSTKPLDIVRFYPNPTNSLLKAEYIPEQKYQRCRIIDMQGRNIWSGQVESLKGGISVDLFRNGIYHVLFDGKFAGRFVKI